MPVKIISDSTCDLSPELINRYNIGIIPLTVTLGEKNGKDGAGIDPDDIYGYVERTGELQMRSLCRLLAGKSRSAVE